MEIHYGDNTMINLMLSFVFPAVIIGTWFPLFDTSAKVVSLRDWSPVISMQLMAVSFVEKDEVPDIPDLAPNEDPEKCPCKGTGKITHGDGHQTDCPFHGELDYELPPIYNPLLAGRCKVNRQFADKVPHKCKCDTDETYCNCVEVHGKCSCSARDPSTESKDSGESPRRNRRSRLLRGGT